jgi:hypothetical protein
MQVVLIIFFYAGPASSILSVVLYKCRGGYGVCAETRPKLAQTLSRCYFGVADAKMCRRVIAQGILHMIIVVQPGVT